MRTRRRKGVRRERLEPLDSARGGGAANPLITLAGAGVISPAAVGAGGTSIHPAAPHAPATLSLAVVGAGVAGAAAPKNAGDVSAGTAPDTYRSDWMLGVLKRLDLGPFSMQRTAMYNAIEEVLHQHDTGLSMRDLIDAAHEHAREELTQKYPGRTLGPWFVARGIVVRLLAQAGVLLDSEGRPIPPGVAGELVAVRSLGPQWREKADSRLVFQLIKAAYEAGKPIGTLPELDRRALAGVLYNTRDKGAVRSVSVILAHLVETKQVVETVDGLFEPAV